ncbi:hypothetical protein B296_00010406 [Ensete ventricosum]|uniref:Uncharacterized protein n=1 Tax=Ensete ventricosum TaxID=4639 RepID=A0A427A9N1_ENSVE|nr:hypothetical protein B296_00010406 [Ensete ventricosum]
MGLKALGVGRSGLDLSNLGDKAESPRGRHGALRILQMASLAMGAHRSATAYMKRVQDLKADLEEILIETGEAEDLLLTVRTARVKSEGDLPSLLEVAPQRVWATFTESQEQSDFPFVLKKIGLGGYGYNITPIGRPPC